VVRVVVPPPETLTADSLMTSRSSVASGIATACEYVQYCGATVRSLMSPESLVNRSVSVVSAARWYTSARIRTTPPAESTAALIENSHSPMGISEMAGTPMTVENSSIASGLFPVLTPETIVASGSVEGNLRSCA